MAIAGIAVDGVDVAFNENGVADETTLTDRNLIRAIVTFVRMSFGSPEDYERLKASYDEQKAQLQSATGYTNWGDYE